ncbi:hypothetical protein ACFXGG_36010, partial [Streptomyces nigra]|uniref:hypothetical protein n=1 Tax=Streptomyces nigra TaxID=1827580 RepID=UPI0036A5C7AC
MHDRPLIEETLDVLRAELEVERLAKAELTTQAAWLAFMRFARQRFATVPTPDSDGLLFQYGTYAFSGRPMFTVDLTRQFDISDNGGEHDHHAQIHCELRYECDPALDALGVLTRRVVDAGDGWVAAECGVAAVVVVGV